MLDLGLSERLGVGTGLSKLGLYKVKTASKSDPVAERKKQQDSSAAAYKSAGVDPSVAYGAPYKGIGTVKGVDKEGVSSIYDSGKSSGGSNNNSAIISNIGKSWDDAGDSISATKKALNTSKNYISNLGKVRDKYIEALDKYKVKTDTAISGNKTLIEKNQKKDLDRLAADMRKNTDNTNVMLGVKGASGGSASRAAARAIASSAGKTRAGVLTSYGDEMSKQNQEAKQAAEQYNIKRNQAYEWEKEARQQAMDDYNEAKSALSRLEKKKGDWKSEDISAMSDRNLNKLFSSLSEISNKAKAFRDGLAAKYAEYGGLADELEVAAVDVDAPAELDTPEFNENIDLTAEENAEDWWDTNKKGTRVIKGYDAMGRPIYEDSLATETPVV